MTGLITINNLGEDVGPFNLYSNLDGFVSAFATDVTRDQLLVGYFSDVIPDGTIIIRVVSTGICKNVIEIELSGELCYKFFPLANYYFTDSIYKDGYTYLYGNFTAYQNGTDSDIVSTGGLIKLNENLTIDKTFDTSPGFNQVLFDGSYIKEDYLGRIVASGTFTSYNGVPRNRLVRILPADGSIDPTFDIGTGFNDFTQAIAFDSNNSIVVGGIFSTYKGVSSPRIIKLLENGDIDTSFVVGTGFNNTVTDILLTSMDNMYVVGYFSRWKGVDVSLGITKLLPNGDRDLNFDGGTGFSPLSNNPNNLLQIEGETSFYVIGYFVSYNSQQHNRIIKLNSDGSVDNTFNAGTGFNDVTFTSQIIWENKIFITGLFTEYNGVPSFYSIILNSDGSVYLPFSFNNYYQPFVIGNKLYGPISTDCIQLIAEYTQTNTLSENVIYYFQFINTASDISDAPSINVAFLENKPNETKLTFTNGYNVEYTEIGRVGFSYITETPENLRVYDFFDVDVTNIVFDTYYDPILNLQTYISKEIITHSNIYYKFI